MKKHTKIFIAPSIELLQKQVDAYEQRALEPVVSSSVTMVQNGQGSKSVSIAIVYKQISTDETQLKLDM